MESSRHDTIIMESSTHDIIAVGVSIEAIVGRGSHGVSKQVNITALMWQPHSICMHANPLRLLLYYSIFISIDFFNRMRLRGGQLIVTTSVKSKG
jgi:hypothetical protein